MVVLVILSVVKMLDFHDKCMYSLDRFTTVLCFVSWLSVCLMLLSSPTNNRNIPQGTRGVAMLIAFVMAVIIARALKTFMALVECAW